MLVLVEGHGVGAELVVVDAVLPLLAQLEVLDERPLHHHVFAAPRADPRDVTLCVHYQDLEKKKKENNVQPALDKTIHTHKH